MPWKRAFINNANVQLLVVKTKKSKIAVLADPVAGEEASLLPTQIAPCLPLRQSGSFRRYLSGH